MKKILFFCIFTVTLYTNENLKSLLRNGQLEEFEKQFELLKNEEKILLKEELLQIIVQIKNGLFDLERFIKRSRDKQIVVPFHQWGQDENNILIFIKFSHRKDAPGCLDIQQQELSVNNEQMIFTASCDQSHRKLEFYLKIDLINEIEEWNVEKQSVGTAIIKLKKKDNTIWRQIDKENSIKIWYELKNPTMREFLKQRTTEQKTKQS